MAAQLILVIEDDPDTVELVRGYLEREGFAVSMASDGKSGLERALTEPPALVVLDLMLPGVDGVEVCRRLRASSDVPVLMLTARADEADKLVGLAVGADDYLTKPFSPRELVGRVKAILRRTEKSTQLSADQKPLIWRDLVLDPARRTVTRSGAPVTLTATEFDLLRVLAQRPERVYTRHELLDLVWGSNDPSGDHTVEVHVANLRRKLEDDASIPSYLLTVRGVGYKLGG